MPAGEAIFMSEDNGHLRKRQERVEAMFRGESLERPLAYMCPGGYAATETDLRMDWIRALRDPEYAVKSQETGIRGVISEDNDNTPLAYVWAGGSHFLDTLFGVRLAVHGPTVWGEPLDCDIEGGGLPEYDAGGGMVPRAIEEIELLRKLYGDIPVTPPDVTGPLNAVLNIFGNRRFLVFAGRDPGGARLALEHVARAIVEVTKLMDGVIGDDVVHVAPPQSWVPEGYALLPQCSTQLISRKLYDDAVRPADEIVAGGYRGVIYHICGDSTHLIPTFCDMDCVKGVELVGSPGSYDPTLDYVKYFNGLRDDQLVYVMVGRNSPDEPFDVTRRERTGRITSDEVMDISGGERTVLRFTKADVLRKFRDNH